jgi:hypothetical protein
MARSPPKLANLFVAVVASLFPGEAYAADLLRAVPYPFSHVVSFAGDADGARPWHSAAIHRVLNEELGLAITDSLWVQGGSESSSLFFGPVAVNRIPSKVATHPTFALLLREWHRGNIDQFHGWQEDNSVQQRNDLVPPVRLAGSATVITLPLGPAEISGTRPQNLRLYFDGRPPADLSLVIHDKDGKTQIFPPDLLAKGHDVQPQIGQLGWITEVLDERRDQPTDRSIVDLTQVSEIELRAPSCATGCTPRLTRIERDQFSRLTVRSEMPFLEAWNLRPALITSHGGNTMMQDFGVPGAGLYQPRTPNTIWEDPTITVYREGLADNKTRHAYHSDLLRKLGVVGVWPYFAGAPRYLFYPIDEQAPPLSETFEGFHNISRCGTPLLDTRNLETWFASISPYSKGKKISDVRELYCGVACNGSQGDAVGLLIYLSLFLIDSGAHVEHFWYTHLGSGGSDFVPTLEEPLTPVVKKWAKMLANRVYNFDGAVPPAHRVWVPPAGTWVRYQISRSAIADHIAVNRSNSTVTIAPWRDEVTGHLIPEPMAGNRDLQGITIYVPEPHRARVLVDGRAIRTFTENPPDETGQRSITIVDDSAATAIIGAVALADRGSVTVTSGTFVDAVEDRADSTDEKRYVTLTADASGKAAVRFKPDKLDLWNTSHLHFSFRKRGDGGRPARGHLSIEIEMEDGGVLAAVEDSQEIEPSDDAGGFWRFAPRYDDMSHWSFETLDTTRLVWQRHPAADDGTWRRPPLPLGRVREVRLSLSDAAAKEAVDIGGLLALRPSGGGTAPDAGLLAAGRVTVDGLRPLSNAVVEAESDRTAVSSTTTDRDGYFFFYGRQKGERLSIHAAIGHRDCQIGQGKVIEMTKNEAELDIVSAACP